MNWNTTVSVSYTHLDVYKRQAYTAVAGWFNEKQAYFADIQALQAENEALRKRNAQLEAAARQGERDSEENELLRQRRNLREQKYELELEAAMVTEHEVTNWTSSLTLDRGTMHLSLIHI